MVIQENLTPKYRVIPQATTQRLQYQYPPKTSTFPHIIQSTGVTTSCCLRWNPECRFALRPSHPVSFNRIYQSVPFYVC